MSNPDSLAFSQRLNKLGFINTQDSFLLDLTWQKDLLRQIAEEEINPDEQLSSDDQEKYLKSIIDIITTLSKEEDRKALMEIRKEIIRKDLKIEALFQDREEILSYVNQIE